MTMQGGVAAISPTQFAMGNDVFRRKLSLGLNQSSGKRQGMAARCLFGPPNPITSNEMVQKVQAKGAWSFGRKWNFDITGKSQPATCLQSTTHPDIQYQWEESYDQDLMAKCDRHRFEVPIAPNARPVTLLFAPTVQMEVDNMVSSIMESVAVQTESPVESKTKGVPILESVSVQTEPADQNMQVDQETQVEIEEDCSKVRKSNKCQLTLSLISCSAPSSQSDSIFGFERTEIHPEDRLKPDEVVSSVSVNVKKERRLPMPLTIPTSPDVVEEEYDPLTSPVENPTSASGVYPMSPSDFSAPIRRRNTIEIFTFPPLESPSGGFKCLRIRSGSPCLPRSGNKKLKQRSITEYMQVKKVKMSCAKKI